MSTSDDFRRPPTAQEAVLEELRRQITTGRIRPEAPIRQSDLAQQLGVSRAPVREALKTLVGEGLVNYMPHRGYFVRALHYADLAEIYRIRTLLETEMALRATEAIEATLATALDAEIAAMEAAENDGDLVALQVHNRRFHFLIFEAADLPHFLQHLKIAWDQTDAYRALYYAEAPNRHRVHDEHRQIVAALRAGDVAEFMQALSTHREHAIEGLATLLERLAELHT